MNESEDNANLEAVVSKLTSLIQANVKVFPTIAFPDDKVILWDGDSIEEFLEFFRDSDKRILYLRQAMVEEEDECPGHMGEIAQLDVAFLVNGYFHTLRISADWLIDQLPSPMYDREAPTDEAKASLAAAIERANELEERKESIASEFVKMLEAGEFKGCYYDQTRGDGPFISCLENFFCDHYGFDESVKRMLYQSPELGRFFNNVSHLAERKLAERLVPRCVDWARESGLKSLKKGDVGVFLVMEDIPVSREAERIIWQKTAFALRTEGV